MVAMLVLGALCFAALIVFGVLAAVASLLGFLIALPFRILGWTLKLVGLLIALPFLLIGAVLTLGFALVPLAPLALLGLGLWLVLRDRKTNRSHATVTS